MPRDSEKTKAQKATKNTKSSTAAASKAKPTASNATGSKSSKRPSASSPRKRGNKGNFHGESLAYLESWFPAYMAAPGKKRSFWDDFCSGWAKKFPPLVGPTAQTTATTESLDPGILFARTVGIEVSAC